MYLNRKDIEKIQEILIKFPNVESFKIDSDTSSGIGSYITMTFDQEVNGMKGSFEIEISGVEDW